MKKVNTTIPVRFEMIDQTDSRFQKVKISLMHLGLNYNNSIFTKEAVENAIDSLKNTPILGYIEEGFMGDADFRGHEVELVVEDGELKSKYIGKAYGVIPENCNPRFETKKGDFDNDLDYLVVDGLMWTKFDDGVEIVKNRGSVAQSMELHDEYDGYWNEDGKFVFTKFSFYGACLLGKDVSPAMQNASVEPVFSSEIEVDQDELVRKIEEFKLSYTNKYNKEVEYEMKLEDLLSKYSTTIEDLKDKGIDVEKYSIEDLEEELEKQFSENPNVEDDNGDEGSVDPEDGEGDNKDFQKDNPSKEGEGDSNKKFTLSFEISHDDIRSQMWNKIDSHMAEKGIEYDWFYIVSVYDDYTIVENEMGSKFYKVGYSKENDVITFGDIVEVYPMFLTSDEKGALELMRANFEKLEEENTELKQFKSSILEEQHKSQADELFSRFSKLSEDEISDLKEDVNKYSIEEIESILFERLGRKMANFSDKKKNHQNYSMKISVNAGVDGEKNSYAHIFKKHGFNV